MPNDKTTKFSWPARLWLGWSALVLPAICFTLSFNGFALAEWQNGEVRTFAAILLDGDHSLIFAPFAVIAWLAALASLIPSSRLVTWWPVRFGLATGIIVALQYIAVVGAQVFMRQWWPDFLFVVFAAIAIEVGSLGLVSVGRFLCRKTGRHCPVIAVFTLVAAWAAGAVAVWYEARPAIDLSEVILTPLAVAGGFIIIGSLGAAPVWALHAYARLTWQASRPSFAHSGLIVFPLWLAAWGIAWREAVNTMFETYSSLPAQPPDCFVATAAANGHARFVGPRKIHLALARTSHQFRSETAEASCPGWVFRDSTGAGALAVRSGGRIAKNPAGCGVSVVAVDIGEKYGLGEIMMRTRQLQTLKALELTLMALAPTAHRHLRSLYDRIGPNLASHVTTPWRADIAWLILEPAAWFGAAIVRLAAGPRSAEAVRRIYQK